MDGMRLLGIDVIVVERNATYLNAHWIWSGYKITVGYCLN